MFGLSKKKIMILDDDAAFSKLIKDFFKMQGYDVLMAEGVEDAIEQFSKHKPKVVLLDYSMPLVNGDQFMPLLQQMEPAVKVIVVSGCTVEEVQGKFSGMGYYAYFEKGSYSLVDIKNKVDEAYTAS